MGKKKDILFIISTLRCGGAEHALVSLLNVFDYTKNNVDLLVLCENGMFYKEDVPGNVNMVEPDLSVRGVLEPTSQNMLKCLKAGRWNLLGMHTCRILKNYIKKPRYKNFWSYYWQEYSGYIKGLTKKYDVAIGYLEGLSNYFCIDKVKADLKIGWVHTNYADSSQNKEMDKKYFKEFDYLVTMSEPASETLATVFPEYAKKIYTIHNILDKKQVLRMAEEPIAEWDENFKGLTIASVGNILPVKGYDMAVEACARLVEAGQNIKWYVVGRKDKSKEIEELIERYHLQQRFILIGPQKNPYPFMKKADIYVQCSRYEGLSTTIREAKTLCKPIVATNCQGINDQIEDRKNGSLVDVNVQSIFQGIMELIEHPETRKGYQENLKQELIKDNETKKELEKLDCLLNKGDSCDR